MNEAVVFGIRGAAGFEMACRLLENGCSVIGLDGEESISELEDKLMMIGRNANFSLVVAESLQCLPDMALAADMWIIPAIDWTTAIEAVKQMENIVPIVQLKSDWKHTRFVFIQQCPAERQKFGFHKCLQKCQLWLSNHGASIQNYYIQAGEDGEPFIISEGAARRIPIPECLLPDQIIGHASEVIMREEDTISIGRDR